MNKLLQSLPSGLIPAINPQEFAAGIFLTWALCTLLGRFYVRYGQSVSDRDQFASNFAILGMATMLVISIVKSSLALSLGLVGALSIVRFRTAVKDPEELSFLFLNIAIGLGLGANQIGVTLMGFLAIILAVWFKARKRASIQPGYYLVIDSPTSKISATQAAELLEKYAQDLTLKRFDQSGPRRELSFVARFNSPASVDEFMLKVKGLDKKASISLLERKGELA